MSISCGKVVWSARNQPLSTAFDKGACGSSPISVSAPVKPSARSASAARSPASEAPTITIRPGSAPLAEFVTSRPHPCAAARSC
jgi:hypothetical protein